MWIIIFCTFIADIILFDKSLNRDVSKASWASVNVGVSLLLCLLPLDIPLLPDGSLGFCRLGAHFLAGALPFFSLSWSLFCLFTLCFTLVINFQKTLTLRYRTFYFLARLSLYIKNCTNLVGKTWEVAFSKFIIWYEKLQNIFFIFRRLVLIKLTGPSHN